MSLSFEESLKKKMASAAIEAKNIVEPSTMDVNSISIADASIMTLDEDYGIAAYSGDDGN